MTKLKIAVSVVTFLVSASAHAAHSIPLGDFARHAQFRDIRISPDGDYVAASAVVDGKAVLSLIHLADMKGVNVRPRDEDEVAQFWWVGAHRLLYSVGEKTGGLEQPVGTGELFAVDADGGSPKLLVGYRANAERVSAEVITPVVVRDNRVLITRRRWNGSRDGAFPTAAWLDLATGASIDVASAPLRNARFVADREGEIRFAFATGDDQKMRVYYRTAKGDPWELVMDESKSASVATPIRFNRDETSVYFNCGGEHGVGGICLWSIASHTLVPLWSGSESGAVELLPTFDDRDVFAIRSMPGRPKTSLIGDDSREAKLLAALVPQFPAADVVFTSYSKDGGKVVFLVSADNDPGQFFLYDAATKKATFLFSRMPWIKPESMATSEPIALKARDGLALHGYLTRPLGDTGASRLPMVVMVHGGPYGIRDEWGFDPEVQAFASRGYAVLQVNFRGSGGYGGAFERAGFRQWGGTMQDDLTDATHWAIAQGIADPRRVCIFGASYGGYAALEGAVKEPDLYRCAVGYVGVYDLRLMYTRGDIPQSRSGENYLKMVLGEDESVLWDRSPIAHLDTLKAQVMLIVGGADNRVPPIQGENLHAALDRAHIRHEWLYQRTEGHGFYDEQHRKELLELVIAFLDRNTAATEPPVAER